LGVLPGDETAVVKGRSLSYFSQRLDFEVIVWIAAIETEAEADRVQWAAAGSNVTLYLTAIDPIHLDVGRVLCPPTNPIALASAFTARIIVFDIQVPILAGTSVSEKPFYRYPLRPSLLLHRHICPALLFLLLQIELFHQSRDVPAAISKLNVTLDRASGAVTKRNPRYVPGFFSLAVW
jgi:elongation factor 1 alpha-like protein